MTDTVETLVHDLLEWVGTGRPYAEVMDAWKTSCPRLPVWEEATGRGLLACSRDARGVEWVHVTSAGRRSCAVAESRPSSQAHVLPSRALR